MKNKIVCMLFLIASVPVLAQDISSIQKELLEKTAQLDSAISRHDSGFVAKLLSNDARITFSNGLSLNKNQAVKLVTYAHIASDSKYDKVQCWLTANVAVLSYKGQFKQELNGKIGDYEQHVLSAWRLEKDQWLLVNSQTTTIPRK
jgi:Domain of unknown function (DUF4440)